MTQAALTPESVLRPLMLAAIGSGVLALSLLQFSADAIPLLELAGKRTIAGAIRAAFFGFLGCSAALLIGYLTSAWKSERLALAFNIYGALSFIVGSALAGGHVGGALRLMAGEDGMPPSVALLFLFNMIAVFTLGLLAIASLVRARRSRTRLAPERAEA